MSQEQAAAWNEGAGRAWVARQEQLDAQLEPLGEAAIAALAPAPGDRVIDVGCGAGATTLALAGRVGPGSVLGVDVSAPLVARARERARGVSNVRFELADAQTFALEPSSFDAVFSRFGVMFFGDPVVAFRNVRAALRPSGRLAFVCWRDYAENPSFSLPIEAARSLLSSAPEAAPSHAPGPFAFADGARVRSILEAAGFAHVEVAPRDGDVVFGGGDLDGAVDLAFHVGPLSRAAADLDDALRDRIRAAVRDELAKHLGPRGVTVPAATWVVTARATVRS